MIERFRKKLIVDPTSPYTSPIFFSFIQKVGYAQEYKSYVLNDRQFYPYSSLELTHPLFVFTKPSRLSKKTGAPKPLGRYIAVYDPNPLGIWKLRSSTSHFRCVEINR